jgi:hypothetical protein
MNSKNIRYNEYRACAILVCKEDFARTDSGFSRRSRTSGKMEPLFPNPQTGLPARYRKEKYV